jgi:hypothetical protein
MQLFLGSSPGDAIREQIENQLLPTDWNSKTTSPTFLSDSCSQPPTVPYRSVGWEPCYIWGTCSWKKMSFLLASTYLLPSPALGHSLASALGIMRRCCQWRTEDSQQGLYPRAASLTRGDQIAGLVVNLWFLHLPQHHTLPAPEKVTLLILQVHGCQQKHTWFSYLLSAYHVSSPTLINLHSLTCTKSPLHTHITMLSVSIPDALCDSLFLSSPRQ